MNTNERLDQNHLWHPYTRFSSFRNKPLPIITHGEGIYLFDSHGNRYVDAISSWWCCALGHRHPKLIQAIKTQTDTLQHSILGNLSHEPAIRLAAKLSELTGGNKHTLFASDGASAVEAALKIALQYHYNTGNPQRKKIISLEGAYHGDTLGTISIGLLESFHKPFQHLLPHMPQAPFPMTAPSMECNTS